MQYHLFIIFSCIISFINFFWRIFRLYGILNTWVSLEVQTHSTVRSLYIHCHEVLYLFVSFVYWSDVKIRQINADLRHVLLLQEPADGLAFLQAAWLAVATPLAAQV